MAATVHETTQDIPVNAEADLEALKAIWQDDSARWDRAAKVWEGLPSRQRCAALSAAEGYQRQCLLAGKRILAPATFLKNEALIERHSTFDIVTLKHWSKGWWAVLHHKMTTGLPVSFDWQQALRFPAKSMSIRTGKAPSVEARNALFGIPSNSDAGTAWLRHLAGQGLPTPEFDEPVWLWMPAAWPGGIQERNTG